jgi:hypothetical protein
MWWVALLLPLHALCRILPILAFLKIAISEFFSIIVICNHSWAKKRFSYSKLLAILDGPLISIRGDTISSFE